MVWQQDFFWRCLFSTTRPTLPFLIVLFFAITFILLSSFTTSIFIRIQYVIKKLESVLLKKYFQVLVSVLLLKYWMWKLCLFKLIWFYSVILTWTRNTGTTTAPQGSPPPPPPPPSGASGGGTWTSPVEDPVPSRCPRMQRWSETSPRRFWCWKHRPGFLLRPPAGL